MINGSREVDDVAVRAAALRGGWEGGRNCGSNLSCRERSPAALLAAAPGLSNASRAARFSWLGLEGAAAGVGNPASGSTPTGSASGAP